MKIYLLYTSAILILIACEKKTNNENILALFVKSDSLVRAKPTNHSSCFKPSYHEPSSKELEIEEQKIAPVFGYRFMIDGDFNGDKKKETLIEHFYSKKFKRESNKFYDSLDYDHLVRFTALKEPISFVTCTNKNIDTLHIADKVQLLGLLFMKNEGDLNDDGADEISYVVNNADWSNLSTYHITSYKNGKWRELYSFAIWDYQNPTGLITKMKNGKTRIIYRTNLSEVDTLFIKL